jgi:hypothetical protein
MSTWVLIIWINSGFMAEGDSNAMAVVPGFLTSQSCEIAGNAAKRLVSGTRKDVHWVCVEQPGHR